MIIFSLIGSSNPTHPRFAWGKTPDIDVVCSYQDWKTFISWHKQEGKLLWVKPTSKNKQAACLKWQGRYRIFEAECFFENGSGENAEKLMGLIVNELCNQHTFNLSDSFSVRMIEAPLNVLYMLKMSHRFLKNSPHFIKTMGDIKLMRRYGASIQDNHKEFLLERELATYNYKHPKLNVKKDEFFTANVNYVYDHDSLHEAVKLYDRPAYQYFKIENADVACSKKQFMSLPENLRLASVLEEALVLSIERSIISKLRKGQSVSKLEANWAFTKALEKICTSISSGWWRAYAWENYDKVLAKMEELEDNGFNVLSKLEQGIKNGVVRFHLGGSYATTE